MADVIIHRDLTATRHAIVENGVVISVTLLDIELNPDFKPPRGELVQCDDSVSVNDLFDGVKFIKPISKDTPLTPSVDTLVSILLKKGVVSQKDIDDAETSIAIDTKTGTPII